MLLYMTSNGVNGTVFDVLCQTTSTDSEKIARFPSLLTEHEKMQSQIKRNFAYVVFLQQELPYFHVLRQSSVTTVL